MRAARALRERDECRSAVDHTKLAIHPVGRHRASLRNERIREMDDRSAVGLHLPAVRRRFRHAERGTLWRRHRQISNTAGVVLDHVIARCPYGHHQRDRSASASRHPRDDAGEMLVRIDHPERVLNRLERPGGLGEEACRGSKRDKHGRPARTSDAARRRGRDMTVADVPTSVDESPGQARTLALRPRDYGYVNTPNSDDPTRNPRHAHSLSCCSATA